MSVNISLCPASIKDMDKLNRSLKPYGTPYLLPGENDCVCMFKFFCDNESCTHHNKSYFQEIPYPYEYHVLKNPEDAPLVNEAAEQICNYYGLFKKENSANEGDWTDKRNGLLKHAWDENRTFFGREYDRVICTNAFRHLQYKTQVMVNSASDDQRTRLLHSLEVQKIAKKIAMGIGANWELAEIIAISHDIGHAPFGHEGEHTIKTFLKGKNSGVFSHALQRVKVLNETSEHPLIGRCGINGLGLSDYVLEGVLKHDSDTFSDGMLEEDYKAQYDIGDLYHVVGLRKQEERDAFDSAILDFLESNKFTPSERRLPQVLIGSVESQVVAWADKIAYLGHDWEEFIDTGLLEKLMSRINDMVFEIEDIVAKTAGKVTDNEEDQIIIIWESLGVINQLYSETTGKTPNQSADKWCAVQTEIHKIIKAVNDIETNGIKVVYNNEDKPYYCHKYFTADEYNSFRNYFIMTASWANLLGVYPRTHGLKNDPIYVFYQFLTKVRSNIITPHVSELLIQRTNSYVDSLDKTSLVTRTDYLLDCNKKWAYKYAKIYRLKTASDIDDKKARKLLKDSIRTCFLVGFHDAGEELDYIVGYKNDKEKEKEDNKNNIDSGYDFTRKYNCLLYIIGKIIKDEFIFSTRVKFMKYTANEIIRTLLNYYYDNPDMLPSAYRARYNAVQHDLAIKKNIPEVDLQKSAKYADSCRARVVADYVADMTDRMAKLKFDEIKSSDTKWSNAYAMNMF